MLVHKINFKVHGSSYCNENNIEIQEEIAHILKEYKKNNWFNQLYGGYTKREIIDMNLSVSEYEGYIFSGSLKKYAYANETCYKVYIDTFDNKKFHIGYVPKNIIEEITQWLNKEDLKCITNIEIIGGKCKHYVLKQENYNDIETVETEFLNYGFKVELRFCNNLPLSNDKQEKKKENFLHKIFNRK